MILAIDIGTSFLKVALVDYNGDIQFLDKFKLEDINNAKSWLLGLKHICLGIPNNLIFLIRGIVVSGNGPTLVPLDIEGEPVGDVMLWNDIRPEIYTNDIKNQIGTFIPPNFFLSKVYWLKKIHPDIYERTYCFLSCPEYISYVLTGNMFTVLPSQGYEGFYWDNNKIDRLGLDKQKFPKFISPFETYGKFEQSDLLPELPKLTPVICGGPDFIMSILGSGSVKEGILCDRTGTSEGLNYCSSSGDVYKNLRTLPHIVSGLYTIAGLIPNSGEYLEKSKIDDLVLEYSKIINDILSHGLTIKEIRIIGGHSSISELNIKKSKAFPIPLKIYKEGSDLIGNAVLGAVVLGQYIDLEEACSVMVKEAVCYNI